MSRRYKPYPEYKDSRVEWLELIPKAWESVRLKYVTERSSGKVDGSKGSRYVGLENIESGTGKFIESGQVESEGTSERFSTGDVLFGKLRPYLAKSWMASFSGVCSSEFIVLKGKLVSPRFLKYYTLTEEFVRQVDASTYGSKMPRAGWEFISLMDVPCPSFSESDQIADFLDHETAKIDHLIRKQEALIELLKEKKEAVISQAVTKGLNPDAPMKDSGVTWLGDVPKHWGISQLKYNTVLMQTGPFGSQIHADDYIENGRPLINPSHIVNGEIIPDFRCSVSDVVFKRLDRHKLLQGELILARRGELGRCAVVKNDQEGWLCGTGSLKAKLSEDLAPEYAQMLISSEGVCAELSLESRGSTMENLNTETLGQIRLPIPPRSEQEEILNIVDTVSKRYNEIEIRARSQVDILQERRAALISAAVTGKIDVRDWKAPEPDATEDHE